MMVNAVDFKTLKKAANSMGMTVSVMFKEAAFRMAEEIREKGNVSITQSPKKPTDPKSTSPFERRYIFIVDTQDYETLRDYAGTLGTTASFMLREGVDRLVNDIRKTKKIKFERPFDTQEGVIK